MKLTGSILIFILSALVVACASAPKPKATPEEEAVQTFKTKGETYLELCEQTCGLPGLFGDEEKEARLKRVEKVPGSAGANGEISPEGVSDFEAANDFANRFNRAMLEIARKK